MMHSIVPTTVSDVERIALIIREANKDIAQKFLLNIKNAPNHPSFYTVNRVLSDLERGEKYFLCKRGEVEMGCVAFEQPDENTAYLNRLSVLPNYRHCGIGGSLVNYVLDYSRKKSVKTVSIGIIADHHLLRRWYSDLGFVAADTRTFDHLPFDVSYMHYDL